MKKCSQCSRDLPLLQFYKNALYKDGYEYRCKECKKAQKANSVKRGHRHASTLREAFFNYVTPGAADSCWEWQGARMKSTRKYNLGLYDYGTLRFNYKLYHTHRVSYELHKGGIPDGMRVLHTCDNPPCVNPNHLILGTALDNTLDGVAKGRIKTWEQKLNT